jgi:hypothetical protein
MSIALRRGRMRVTKGMRTFAASQVAFVFVVLGFFVPTPLSADEAPPLEKLSCANFKAEIESKKDYYAALISSRMSSLTNGASMPDSVVATVFDRVARFCDKHPKTSVGAALSDFLLSKLLNPK